MLGYQADYERMRATLVRLLSIPVARNVAVKLSTYSAKGAKNDLEGFWLDLDEQMLGGLVLSTRLLSLRNRGTIFE